MPRNGDMCAVDLAAREATKSAETFRLGAVLLRRRRVVARGRNRNDNGCGLNSVHAEMDALFSTGKNRAGGCHLVVARVRRNGDMACSKPCPSCAHALARAGIAKVTYTTGDPREPVATWRF